MGWLTLSKTQGTGDTQITLSAFPNDSGLERAQDFRVKTENAYVDVHVVQRNPYECSRFVYEVTADNTNITSNATFAGADKMRLDGGEWVSTISSIYASTGTHILEVRHFSGTTNFSFAINGLAANNFYLKEVHISPNVTGGLSSSTLSNNTRLEVVELSPNYTQDQIAENFCSGCSALTSFTLPTGVTVINRWAFSGCTNLVNFNIPLSSSLYEIKNGVFIECSSLISFHFPYNFQSLGNSAFFRCASLTGVSFENIDNCTSLGGGYGYCFESCYSLTGFTWPPNVQILGILMFGAEGMLGAEDGIIPMAFTGVTFDIDCALTSIKDLAFMAYYPYMTSFTIPRNVTSLDSVFAHGRLPNLTTIYAYPTTAPSVVIDTFGPLTDQTGTLHYPAGSDYSSWLSLLNGWTGVADL